MNRVTVFTAVFPGILLSLTARAGFAQPGAVPGIGRPGGAEPVRAELVSDCRAVRPGEPFWAGVHLVMTDGWHVNWINPGDAGLAPDVDWTLPPGFSAGEIQWPYPKRFDISGLAIFGYENETVLLCRLTPPAELPDGEEIAIAARVAWLACREACVPGEADLSLSIPVDARSEAVQADARWKTAIERSRNDIPFALAGWRIEAKAARDVLSIVAAPLAGETPAIDGAAFFPLHPGIIENGAPQKWTREGAVFRLEVRLDRMNAERPARLAGVIVSGNGWGKDPRRAVVVDVPVD